MSVLKYEFKVILIKIFFLEHIHISCEHWKNVYGCTLGNIFSQVKHDGWQFPKTNLRLMGFWKCENKIYYLCESQIESIKTINYTFMTYQRIYTYIQWNANKLKFKGNRIFFDLLRFSSYKSFI